MSPMAGQMLVDEIAPILMATLPRVAKPIGGEDAGELQQDALAQAAAMVDSAERRGKTVAAQSVAFYVIQAVRSGRRSTGASRTDVLAPGTALDGKVSVDSMDDEVEMVDDDGEGCTLHGLLADPREDAGSAVARQMDWDLVTGKLNDQRRRVLRATAEGYGTGEIAAMCGVSAPRVCQVRESIGPYIVEAWDGNGLADVATEPSWKAGMRAVAERRAGRYERARS